MGIMDYAAWAAIVTSLGTCVMDLTLFFHDPSSPSWRVGLAGKSVAIAIWAALYLSKG